MALRLLGENLSDKYVHRSLPESFVDLTGRVVIVTGSNTGLGLEAVKMFYKMNPARLIMAVRTVSKGESARQQVLQQQTRMKSGTSVEVWQLDMSSFASVKQFAQRCYDELERIDIFLANAGTQSDEWGVTTDGWENTLQINVLSTHLLTLLVHDKLVRTARLPPPKVGVNFKPHLVIVSSGVHLVAPFKDKNQANIFAALNTESRYVQGDRYFDSKLLEILITRHISKIPKFSQEASGVVMCTVNPGFCRSELMRRSPSAAIAVVGTLLMRPAREGAKAIVWACLDNNITQGAYTSNCAIDAVSKFVRSKEGDDVSRKLWNELVVILDTVAPERQEAWKV
ncbi:hypothetical protein PIIN_06768 [Serendipita indica DSM 11827]|uniref:Uncharacterized protein n=1 Tax=Serendipita indica (strain DSM 11827) TaxID=1109443 RepID=G4TND9_SERID|nr:hypothetical protein PIIN_06768 [Serendipita indica DSM 11827]